MVKNPLANSGEAREADLIPGSGRSPGGRHGNPLQYSYLENPMDREVWQTTVHRVHKNSDTTEATWHITLIFLPKIDQKSFYKTRSLSIPWWSRA